MRTVAERLKYELIMKAGRSVTDLAPSLSITRPALSNVLNGNASLSIELAIKIEAAFGLSAKKLLIAQLEEGLADVRSQMEHS